MSLFQDGTQILSKYVEDLWENKVDRTGRLRSPEEIIEAFRETGADLDLTDGSAVDDDAILKAVQCSLDNSVHTNHRFFYNQLYARTEPVGLLGQWMISAQNGSAYTYEVAPVWTLMELSVVKKMNSLVGWTDGDGMFVPGGSFSNMYAQHLARYQAFPNMKEDGLYGQPPLVGFCSSAAHYSTIKAASLIGIGTKNMIKIPVNDKGEMDMQILRQEIEKALAEGKKPFYVCATAGSTVFGSFDDIIAARRITDEFGMWLHVDGCWGGASLLSKRPDIVDRMAGVELADSFAWNPHKFMGLPQQCCAFLLPNKHKGLLLQCNGLHAAYLFQPDKNNSHLDLGDKTIQCGRLADAGKVWLAWRSVGDAGWEDRMNHGFDLRIAMQSYMETEDFKGRFEIVLEPSFTNLCFWYIPPGMDIKNPHELEGKEWEALHRVAVFIKHQLQLEGKAMIGFQSIPINKDPLPNFFRMVFASVHNVTKEDVLEILRDMDRIGSTLYTNRRLSLQG